MSVASIQRDAIHRRPVTPEDMPFLTYLYFTTREAEMQMVPWTPEQKTAFLLHQFNAQKVHYEREYPDCHFDMLEIDGQPIGRLYLDPRETHLHIVDISIAPAYRNRGIGTLLLQEIIDQARASSRAVGIHVEYNNPARSLYDRLGFRQLRSSGVYHYMEWAAAEAAAE